MVPDYEGVPSVGPKLPVSTTQLNDGTRGTSNAAPAAPAAGNTAPIFAAGELISVRTRLPNERVRLTLNVDRDNDNAAGFGTYRFLVDGAVFGPASPGPTGTAQERTTVIDGVFTIVTAGVHTVGAQVTAAGGTETVAAGSTLVVVANEYA